MQTLEARLMQFNSFMNTINTRLMVCRGRQRSIPWEANKSKRAQVSNPQSEKQAMFRNPD